MTDQPTGMSGAARLRTMRTIAASYLGVIPLIGIALAIASPGDDPWGIPGPLGLLLPAVVGAAGWAGILTIGLNVPPLPASHVEVGGAGVGVYQSTLFVRMALATTPAIVSIVLLFALPGATLITYAIGAAISLVLLAVYVYPNRYNVRLVERRLDRAGARSRLADALGLRDAPDAPTGYTGNARFH